MSMTSTDPIADMLSRIRNAIAVHKAEINLPHSNMKESIANLLKDSNFIDDIKIVDAKVGKTLFITINQSNNNARINEIVRISKPGRRSYIGVSEIPTIKQGRGVVIISTSKGLMTGQQAKRANIGGELICKIY